MQRRMQEAHAGGSCTCLSACVVLHMPVQVSFALPDWKPRLVLDYKAGAGAALWAAQEVGEVSWSCCNMGVATGKKTFSTAVITATHWHVISTASRNHAIDQRDVSHFSCPVAMCCNARVVPIPSQRLKRC